MKVDSVKKNYFLNTILQIALLIVPLITTPYVARVLGVDRVGEYSYALAMVTYFTLFAVLGTGSFGQRQIAFHRENKTELSVDFWNIFLFRCITSSAAIGGYALYLYFSNNVNALCLILGLNILNVAFDISWLFQGVEDFKRIVFRNLFFKIINLVLIFAFVKSEKDLWIYTFIMCGCTFACTLSIWFSAKKYVTFVKERINPFSNFKSIILVFLPTIAIQVYTVLDKSMIGWITNSTYENGCYDKAEQIAKIALTLTTSIAAVILPRISHLYASGDIERAKAFLYKAYRLVWLFSIPSTFGLIAIAPSFIPIFLGDGYEEAVILLRILAALVIFISLAYVTGLSYLVSTKQENVYTIAVSIAAVANLIVNLILIPKLLAVGAAIGTICAEFLGCAIQIGFCIATKQLDWKKIIVPSWKYFVSGALMFVATYFFSHFTPNSIYFLVAAISIGVFAYFGMLLLMRDSLVMEETKRIFYMIFRKRKKEA